MEHASPGCTEVNVHRMFTWLLVFKYNIDMFYIKTSLSQSDLWLPKTPFFYRPAEMCMCIFQPVSCDPGCIVHFESAAPSYLWSYQPVPYTTGCCYPIISLCSQIEQFGGNYATVNIESFLLISIIWVVYCPRPDNQTAADVAPIWFLFIDLSGLCWWGGIYMSGNSDTVKSAPLLFPSL